MLWKIQSQGFDLNHISMSEPLLCPPLPAALVRRGIGRPVMNDCSKDLNQADEGDLLRAEVSDEVIEAASMARGGFPTLSYGTYCFACPSRPARSRQVDQQR